jgi:hypothetical protein
MGLGFDFAESFAGRYYLLARPFEDRPMRCSFQLEVDGMRRFLKDRTLEVKGTVVAEGLAAEGRPLEGRMVWRLLDQRRLPYDLSFEGDDGKRYFLRGQRDFMMHDTTGSLGILPVSIFDESEEEIGRAVLHGTRLTDVPGVMFRSFRPRVRIPRLKE